MRVLHILNELRPSGAETMLRTAVGEWAAQSINCEILSIGASIGPYASALRNAGYKVHHLPAAKNASFFLNLWRFVRSGSYDVVHQHVESMGYWVSLSALMAGAKLVRTIHSNFQYSGNLRLRRLVQRRHLISLGACFVAIAPGVRQNELARFGVRSTLIWNWVDPSVVGRIFEPERSEARAKLGIEEGEFVVLTVGNCSHVKNHSAVIEAIPSLSRNTRIRYLHVGVEDTRCSERALAEHLDCAEKVTFHGWSANVRLALAAADVFVMPSRYEGLGIAALEGLAAGLPMVLARVEGLRDLEGIFPGMIYVEPNAQGIYEGVTAALRDYPALRTQASIVYPDLVDKHFGVRRGAELYKQVYCKALGISVTDIPP